jgi:hypothetical protein
VRKHAPATQVRRYVQIHTIEDAIFDASRSERGTPEPYDGIAELCWDDREKLRPTAERLRALKEIIEDERRFIDLSQSPFLLGKEYFFIDG